MKFALDTTLSSFTDLIFTDQANFQYRKLPIEAW